MFTGLVREVATVRSVGAAGRTRVVEIDAPSSAPSLAIGDSLAVDGICLTVTGKAGRRVRADLSPETLRVTTAGNWVAGRRVHVEPARRVGDELGGHFVLGHVDGVGRVVARRRAGRSASLTIAADAAVLAQLLPKGSIAVDGVSLTLDEGPFDRTFTVMLVPHTLAQTHLASLGRGDRVNLEVDVLAKAARAQRPAGGGPPPEPLTVDAILRAGWRKHPTSA